MTNSMNMRIAACSCGRLTARVVGEPARVSVCHCLNCQRRSGSVFAAQARFDRDAVEISGPSNQYTLSGDEGGKASFHFCPNCGATVYYQNHGLEHFVSIPIGAFAEPNFPAPTISVYEDRKHAWVGLPEKMEHWA